MEIVIIIIQRLEELKNEYSLMFSNFTQGFSL